VTDGRAEILRWLKVVVLSIATDDLVGQSVTYVPAQCKNG